MKRKPTETVIVQLRANPSVTRKMSIASARLNSAKWQVIQVDNKSTPIVDRKIRVCIATAVWKRPEIFRMFAAGIKALNSESVELTVVVAGSEGQISRDMVTSYGFIYVEHDNQPLAKKHNAAIKECKRFRPDYVIMTGSDDVIDNTALAEYVKAMRKGIDFIGVLDFYFYDIRTRKAAYWGGYRDRARVGHTCGAYRCVSARLMNMWGWAPFESKHSHILDDSIQKRLARTEHTSHIFRLKDVSAYGVDIKSDTNMTPFELWDNTSYIDTDFLNNFKYITSCQVLSATRP